MPLTESTELTSEFDVESGDACTKLPFDGNVLFDAILPRPGSEFLIPVTGLIKFCLTIVPLENF